MQGSYASILNPRVVNQAIKTELTLEQRALTTKNHSSCPSDKSGKRREVRRRAARRVLRGSVLPLQHGLGRGGGGVQQRQEAGNGGADGRAGLAVRVQGGGTYSSRNGSELVERSTLGGPVRVSGRTSPSGGSGVHREGTVCGDIAGRPFLIPAADQWSSCIKVSNGWPSAIEWKCTDWASSCRDTVLPHGSLRFVPWHRSSRRITLRRRASEKS